MLVTELPFGISKNDPRCEVLVDRITWVLAQSQDGIQHIICVMVQDLGLHAVEAVMRLWQSKYPYVTLEFFLFCPEQTASWTPRKRKRFERMLRHCLDPPIVNHPAYTKGCKVGE